MRKVDRILIVEAAPSVGGSMTSIEIVLRLGLERGFHFGLCSQVALPACMPTDLQHHQLPHSPRPLAAMVREYLAVRRYIRRNGYQALLLNNLLSANFPALLAGLHERIPVLQMARAYERNSRTWRWLHRRVYSFIAVSHSVHQSLLALGETPQRVITAYEGIASQPTRTQAQREAMRVTYGIPSEVCLLGFIGRLVPWKGADLFVNSAIAAMHKDPNYHAVLIGGAPATEETTLNALHKEIESHQLSHRFHWLGELPPDAVMPALCGFDVLLHTSITPEPFGRVLLEAMSLGIPVISSAEGGPQEIITHQRDGLLAAAHPEALAAATHWLFAEPARGHQIGNAGRQNAQERFAEEVCAGPVLALLEQLSNTPPEQR